MAQLDASIILGGKPAQIESPVNALAKMLQIQEAQQGNQMRGMQMQDAQTARERGNRLSALLGKQYATPEEREGALLEGGFMDEAGKLSKNRLEATKQGVELDEKKFKVANDRYGVYKKTLGALANSPNLSKGLVLQAGQELVDAGVLPAEMFAKVSQGLSDDPAALKADLQRGVASQMTPEQMFTVFAPKPEKMDNGASIGFRDTNPNSPTYGQATAGAAIQKQQSPDSIASNATSEANNRRSTAASYANAQAVRDAASITTGFKNETDLRKEFEGLPEVKNYKQAYPAYASIVDAAKRNTTQSDINIVYGLAKLYDPTSVVREGEYATVANSPNIPEKIKGYAQFLAGGGRLSEETKKQILAEAKGRIGSYEGEVRKAKTSYEGIAKKRGMDPANVFTDMGDMSLDAKPAANPKPIPYGDLK